MSRLKKAARVALQALREIFDEAAYARFLQSAKLPSSPSAYATFWRERESAHAKRVKCC